MRQYAYMQDDGSYKMFRRAATPCVRFVKFTAMFIVIVCPSVFLQCFDAVAWTVTKGKLAVLSRQLTQPIKFKKKLAAEVE